MEDENGKSYIAYYGNITAYKIIEIDNTFGDTPPTTNIAWFRRC